MSSQEYHKLLRIHIRLDIGTKRANKYPFDTDVTHVHIR